MAVKHVTLRAWSDNSDVPPQKINQGDILSRTFIITLIDASGAPIDLTLSSVRVHFTKPDGKVCYIDASIVNASAGIFSVTLDSQCTAVPGLVKTIVQVTSPNGENMYCTGPKISVGAINVENSVASSNEFTALTEALAQVQNIANKADLNTDGKVIQDPASYGKVGGAALISKLPQSPQLVMLNPDGTLSEAAKNTDYVNMETGTLTPFFYGETTAGDIVYSSQWGHYTVIGNLCMVEIQLQIKTINVQPTGNLKLGGWPKAEGNPGTIMSIIGQIAGKSFTGVVAPSTGRILSSSNGNYFVPASTLVNGDFIECTSCYLCKP